MNDNLENIVKSLFEAKYLRRIKRSGTSVFLGDEVNESIPEHSFYTSLWALVIQKLNPDLDLGKLLTMCIIHDLEEVRMGDLNQLNRLYVKVISSEQKAFADMWAGSNVGKDFQKSHKEWEENKTPEAIAAHECDILAELVTVKEYAQKGNKEAEEWLEATRQRFKTDIAMKLADIVVKTRMSDWWKDIRNTIRKKHGIKPKKY